MHTCPVCGYDQLPRAAADHLICPSCGTQFGYHDATLTYPQLRQRWINNGAKWHSRRLAPPPYWSPVAQLRNIGYISTDDDLEKIAHAQQEVADVMTVKATTKHGSR